MRATGTGGLTTVSKTGSTVNISTTNPHDYRNLLKRLTAANRTVNDATHAVFSFAITNTSLYLKALKALEPPEKFALRMLNTRRLVKNSGLSITGRAATVTQP